MSEKQYMPEVKAVMLTFNETIAGTVFDHIDAFIKYSKFNIEILNTNQNSNLILDPILNADIIIIHYTVSIFSDTRLPLLLRYAIRESDALKIIFIQDEYRLIDRVVSGMNFLEINLLFTCVEESEWEKVYPLEKIPSLKERINVLTGYVPENLKPFFKNRPTYEDRPLDVVYRARKLSSWYGRLGREKWEIADKFKKNCHDFNLRCDISSAESDRIYGDDWIKFLQSSKSSLGVESGASVFDFSGKIQKDVENYEKLNPYATLEECERLFFSGLDGKIKLNQISPRAFECATLGTLMILYEGEYSGVLTAWRHYVPLKKDHSNIREVVEALRNKQKWLEITSNAYEEVAINPEYSYSTMIEKFDLVVDKHFIKKRKPKPPSFKSQDCLHLTDEILGTLVCVVKQAYLTLRRATEMIINLYANLKYVIYNKTIFGIAYNFIKQRCYLIYFIFLNAEQIKIYGIKYILDISLISKIGRYMNPNEFLSFQILLSTDKFLLDYYPYSLYNCELIKKSLVIRSSIDVKSHKSLASRISEILKKEGSNLEYLRVVIEDSIYIPERLSGLNLEVRISK